MKKTYFANINFYNGVITYLIILSIWNLFTVFTGNIFGLLPAFIQIVLVILIFAKNQYAKIGLQVFSIVVLIASSGLRVLSALLKALIGEFASVYSNKLLFSLLSLAVGIIILVYTNKTVRVSESDIPPKHKGTIK